MQAIKVITGLIAAVANNTDANPDVGSSRLYGLDDTVSDDMRAILNAREEEYKEILDKELKRIKAKVVARHEKGSGESSKRTIFHDQELRYKAALRRYWTYEKGEKTLQQVATGED